MRRRAAAPAAVVPRAVWPSRASWARLLKALLLAIVLYFVGRAMLRQMGDVPWHQVHVRPSLFGLAMAVHAFASFLNAVAYRQVLAGFAVAPSVVAMCAISWLPNLGKYLPGKFASVAGAIWLLNRHRVPAGTGASVVVVHQGLAVLTGLMLALPLCFWEPIRERFPTAWAYCLVATGVGLVALHPRIIGALANVALRSLGREPLGHVPPWRRYVPPVLVHVVAWMVLGIATWLTARALAPVSPGQLPIFTAAMALASSLGVLAFIPGGIGVREGILLVVLTPLTGPLTSVIVVVLRLLHILVEILLAGVALVILRGLGGTEQGEERHERPGS